MFAYQSRRNNRGSISDNLRVWLLNLDKRVVIAAVAGVVAVAVILAFMQLRPSHTVLLSAAVNADSLHEPASSTPPTTTLLDDVLDTGDTGSNRKGSEAVEICVHISGAVASPGVVYLTEGSRLIDAVNSCGGLSDTAASDYVNLAGLLVDGTHIHIPSNSDIDALREQGVTSEQALRNSLNNSGTSGSTDQSSTALGVEASGGAKSPNTTATAFPVDINHADYATLQTVPGIGPVTAQRIIDYRSLHGQFQRLEDLQQVSGIGEKRFQNMQPYLICR